MQSPRLNRRDILFLTLIVVALSLAFLTGFLGRGLLDAQGTSYPLLDQVIGIIRANGLTDLPDNPVLEYGLIQGLIQAYKDPFTTFVEPAQAELQTDQLEGHYGGIGARMERDAAGDLLLYPYPDSPAAGAGIRDGDHLLAVDSLKIDANTALDTIQAAIRGPVGQKVTLTIGAAPAYRPRQVSMARADVALPSVSSNLASTDTQVGVLHINVIAATTPDEIQKAVSSLEQRGATRFILDLRDNGGGLLDAGIDSARLFLKDGVVIQQQYRNKPAETFTVDKPGPLVDLPLVVLVNHNTASAAEIIAGALQVHKRALLVGRPTYGKDTIQLVFDLKDGSSLHVTSARWWVPGLPGSLEGHGLQPDVLLPQGQDDDASMMQAAIQALTR
jgi:carboxyl-terminal processing protease